MCEPKRTRTEYGSGFVLFPFSAVGFPYPLYRRPFQRGWLELTVANRDRTLRGWCGSYAVV
jgi:hypothetical protein